MNTLLRNLFIGLLVILFVTTTQTVLAQSDQQTEEVVAAAAMQMDRPPTAPAGSVSLFEGLQVGSEVLSGTNVISGTVTAVSRKNVTIRDGGYAAADHWSFTVKFSSPMTLTACSGDNDPKTRKDGSKEVGHSVSINGGVPITYTQQSPSDDGHWECKTFSGVQLFVFSTGEDSGGFIGFVVPPTTTTQPPVHEMDATASSTCQGYAVNGWISEDGSLSYHPSQTGDWSQSNIVTVTVTGGWPDGTSNSMQVFAKKPEGCDVVQHQHILYIPTICSEGCSTPVTSKHEMDATASSTCQGYAVNGWISEDGSLSYHPSQTGDWSQSNIVTVTVTGGWPDGTSNSMQVFAKKPEGCDTPQQPTEMILICAEGDPQLSWAVFPPDHKPSWSDGCTSTPVQDNWSKGPQEGLGIDGSTVISMTVSSFAKHRHGITAIVMNKIAVNPAQEQVDTVFSGTVATLMVVKKIHNDDSGKETAYFNTKLFLAVPPGTVLTGRFPEFVAAHRPR